MTSHPIIFGALCQQPQTPVAPSLDTSEMEPELARYLNRNYWEGKAQTTQPSAPAASNTERKSNLATAKQRDVSKCCVKDYGFSELSSVNMLV